MKIKIKNLILSSLTVLVSVLFIAVVVKASALSGLTPPNSAFSSGNPTGTMNTLSDIYNSLPQQWQSDPNLALCWRSTNDAGYEQAHGCLISTTPGVDGGFISATGDTNNPLGAVEYCQYLDQNGTVVDSTPQNYWHLPTEAELMAELENEYLPGGAGFTPSYIPPGGFQGNGNYWSSSGYSSTSAWNVYFNGNFNVYSGHGSKSYQHLVRCVH